MAKTITLAGIIALIVPILIIGGIGFLIFKGVQQQAAIGELEGFQVLSVSPPVQTISSDKDLEGKFWKITASLGGDVDKIVGDTLTPEEVGNLAGGLKTVFPLEISAKASPEILTYGLNPIITQVTLYESVTTIEGSFFTAPPCPSNTLIIGGVEQSITFRQTMFGGKIKKCVIESKIGIIQSLENPQLRNDVLVNFGANGQTAVSNISTSQTAGSGQQTVNIGTRTAPIIDKSTGKQRGKVTFIGALLTGDPLPNHNNRIAYFDDAFNGGQWNIGNRDLFNTYQNGRAGSRTDISAVITRINNKCIICSTQELNELDLVLDNVNKPLADFTSNALSGQSKLASKQIATELNNPKGTKFIVTLDNRRITIPTITMDIDATWIKFVGLVKEPGKPDVLSTSCGKQATGQELSIKADVKNIGKSQDTFDLIVNNCFPLKQLANSISLNAGELTTVNLPVSTTQDGIKQCTLTMKSRTTLVSDTGSSFTCEVTSKPFECNPGTSRVDGSCLVKCTNEGIEERTICCDENGVNALTEKCNEPGTTEVCDNGKDDDGDSFIDEGCGAGAGVGLGLTPEDCAKQDTFFNKHEFAEINEKVCTNVFCKIGLTEPKEQLKRTCESNLSFASLIIIIITVIVLLFGGTFTGIAIFRTKKKGGRK